MIVAGWVLLAAVLGLGGVSDAEAAYRLVFQNGSTLEVPAYEDLGEAIRYQRHGGSEKKGTGHLLARKRWILRETDFTFWVTRSIEFLDGRLLVENPEVLVPDPALFAACRERGIRPGPVGSA